MKTTFFFLFLMLPVFLWAQRGTVTGIMKDSDGIPLPGCNVIVEGTSNGTQTDFDGRYSIECSVGDLLIFSYIGMKPQSLRIQPGMLDSGKLVQPAPQVVEYIRRNRAFRDSLVYAHKKEKETTEFDRLAQPYLMDRAYLSSTRLKTLKRDSLGYVVTHSPEKVYYEIELDQKTSTQFVPLGYRPQLQRQFAQGSPSASGLAWAGPESGEAFSYGPALDNLEFDGSAYAFDNQGRLVPAGQGNGIPAEAYNNRVLERGTNTTTNLRLRLAQREGNTFSAHYHNNRRRDIFGRASNQSNQFNLDSRVHVGRIRFKGKLNFASEDTGNANINGLHSQILQSAWITPPSFSNMQGNRLPNGEQRSYHPGFSNNPTWLLHENNNRYSSDSFKATFGISESYFLSFVDYNLALSYGQQKQQLQVFLPNGTVGFDGAYNSTKGFDRQDVSADLHLGFDSFDVGAETVHVESDVSWQSARLNYRFDEAEGSALFQNERNLNNATLQWTTKARLVMELAGEGLEIAVWNNVFSSQIQGTEWLLPTLKTNMEIYIGGDFLNSIDLLFGHSKNVVDFPLFYENTSHNSLTLNQSNNQEYTANNDLFLSSQLAFETVQETYYQLALDFFNNKLRFSGEYYDSRNRKGVFPVFTEGSWELQNAADIRNKGFEFELSYHDRNYDKTDLHWESRFNFSRNRPVVERVYGTLDNRLPIAGFSSVRKQLIEGSPVGLITGTGYQRNSSGQRIIGSEGFPFAAENVVIGNPNPDFVLGWSNTLSLEGFSLQFVFDFQKGGDVWNGTQGALNYFGTSLESALKRSTENFVFEGVNELGQPNTQEVSFAPPTGNVLTNRWTRYGYGGLDEESITDGTYLNLRSASLSYTKHFKKQDFAFRVITLRLFTNNILRWGMARELNPYSTLYGGSSGDGLHFFNQPLLSEAGFQINLKF